MLSVGVDIIEVARVQHSIDRHGDRFLDRIFTASEQSYCTGRVERFAARFAVKEAVSKALGTGIGAVGWRDIEVAHDERGRPELVLHRYAAELANELALREWSISMSHSNTHAIGMAVALGNG